MAKATNLTRKKHDKSSAKIDEDGAILFGVANWVHIHLEPTSTCGINVVGGGGGRERKVGQDAYVEGCVAVSAELAASGLRRCAKSASACSPGEDAEVA